jgi:double-strand break repair protein MRE11
MIASTTMATRIPAAGPAVLPTVPPDLTMNNDPDTFRIMISSDNHLGFAEKDPVRGDDSFAAFEEMLYLARKHRCDTVLVR